MEIKTARAGRVPWRRSLSGSMPHPMIANRQALCCGEGEETAPHGKTRLEPRGQSVRLWNLMLQYAARLGHMAGPDAATRTDHILSKLYAVVRCMTVPHGTTRPVPHGRTGTYHTRMFPPARVPSCQKTIDRATWPGR